MFDENFPKILFINNITLAHKYLTVGLGPAYTFANSNQYTLGQKKGLDGEYCHHRNTCRQRVYTYLAFRLRNFNWNQRIVALT